jgi:hypothetical protein
LNADQFTDWLQSIDEFEAENTRQWEQQEKAGRGGRTYRSNAIKAKKTERPANGETPRGPANQGGGSFSNTPPSSTGNENVMPLAPSNAMFSVPPPPLPPYVRPINYGYSYGPQGN